MPNIKNKSTRLFYIIEVLKNARRPLKLKEILAKLEDKFALDGTPIQLSERTFFRDIKELRNSPYMLDITANEEGYMITGAEKDDWDVTRLLEPFHLLQTLDIESGVHQILLGQSNHQKGTVWLNPLIRAIRDHKVLRIYYQKHHEGDFQERRVEPYYIKEFNGRWYLIAFDRDAVDFRTFGLDRIMDISVSNTTFKRDENYDVKKQFEDSYGIYSDPKYPVEDIVFEVDQVDAYYIRTNPLHHSQQEITQTGDSVSFSIRVRYTKDLLMALLSRSWSMKIISPEYIKLEYAGILKEAYERNKE